MEVTRRAFLQLTGLMAGTTGAFERFIRHRLMGLPAPADDVLLTPHAPEQWLPSVCQLCPAGCGVAARVVNGRVVKLEGLPAHPINQGSLCPRGLAGLTELYHPDRLLQPMKRIGERGEGRFEPIGWDEAIRTLIDRLRTLHQRGESHRVAWLSGHTAGIAPQLIERFLRGYGATRHFVLSPPTGELPVDAFHMMVDWQGQMLYDLAQATLILSFGMDWLQAYPSPVEASRAYGHLRRGQPDRRVRVVQIEPRLSVTAAKSDEWLPVRPGQEGWLALSMAHVLIRDRLFHERFVQDSAVGFEEFSRFVESHASPEQVAEPTGIPAETIVRVATEFGLRRGLAVGSRADALTQWAVMSLNGLVGNIDARGGILRRWEPEALSLPAAVTPTDAPMLPTDAQALPALLQSQQPSPIEVLVLSSANPCFLSPSPSRWADAFKAVPWIVSCTAFLDETALHADLLLPTATALEQWQYAPTTASDGTVVATICRPVLAPRNEARGLPDLILQLAQAFGPPLDNALPWHSLEQLVMDRLHALYDAKVGLLLPPISVPGTPAPSVEKPAMNVEEFGKELLARGGLLWPAEASPWPEFRTPSRQFEFVPRAIAERLKASPTLFPTEESAAAAGFPLQLYLYSPLAFLNGYGAHLPHLQQIAGSQLHEAWVTWAEIHPSTAGALGIRDGESIWVASAHGRITVKARWSEGIQPSVIAIPLGLGHTAHGRWAQGIGENPACLIEAKRDPQTGQPLWQGTWVKVWKA
ncbi:MAG: molybdopterin-dependent oxidoreductase [Candidatus Omnitrophica bacterium]|nr:molybdopterin-dependent oxidoreductase [Candidatus Omnitrophota bacterium]